jgi:hypothetical protein
MQLAQTQHATVFRPDTGFRHSGALVRWTKRPGEPVEAGELLGLVEIDIAEFELFAPRIRHAGEAVTVGQRLADFVPRRLGRTNPKYPQQLQGR